MQQYGSVESNTNNYGNDETSTRDIYDHDKYDFNILQKNQNFELPTKDYWFKIYTAISAYLLFNSVITIMSLAFNYQKNNLTNKVLNTAWLVNTAVYSPLGFFLLYYLLFNNYYAEHVYYKFLRRGAIIDYPPPSYSHVLSIAFLVPFLGYFGFTCYYFLGTGANWSTFFVFVSNLFVGIFTFWMRQQQIESRFISLSEYIQCFPNAKRKHNENMDRLSLKEASNAIEKLVLLETRDMSYSNYMRLWLWDNENYGTFMSHLLRGSVFVFIAVAAAVAFYFFQSQLKAQDRDEWVGIVQPCIEVCLRHFSYSCECFGECMNATDQMGNKYCSPTCEVLNTTCGAPWN